MLYYNMDTKQLESMYNIIQYQTNYTSAYYRISDAFSNYFVPQKIMPPINLNLKAYYKEYIFEQDNKLDFKPHGNIIENKINKLKSIEANNNSAILNYGDGIFKSQIQVTRSIINIITSSITGRSLHIDKYNQLVKKHIKDIKLKYNRDLVKERILRINREIEFVESILSRLDDDISFDNINPKADHLKFSRFNKIDNKCLPEKSSVIILQQYKTDLNFKLHVNKVINENNKINEHHYNNNCYKYIYESIKTHLKDYLNYLKLCKTTVEERPYYIDCRYCFNDVARNFIITKDHLLFDKIKFTNKSLYNEIIYIKNDKINAIYKDITDVNYYYANGYVLARAERYSKNQYWNIFYIADPNFGQLKRFDYEKFKEDMKQVENIEDVCIELYQNNEF